MHIAHTYLPVVDVPPSVAVHASPVELSVLPTPAVRLCAPDDRVADTSSPVMHPDNGKGKRQQQQLVVFRQWPGFGHI